MSEHTVVISILTAMLALLYLIAVRLGHLINAVRTVLMTIANLKMAVMQHANLPESQPESETPAPFKDWDES
tara:strand:+ start:687 stop:902 length:216 start_codon:yes stop_codon:yes gene_type:complete